MMDWESQNFWIQMKKMKKCSYGLQKSDFCLTMDSASQEFPIQMKKCSYGLQKSDFCLTMDSASQEFPIQMKKMFLSWNI